MHGLCQGFELLPQAVHHGQTAGNGQDLIRPRPQALEFFQGQRVNPLGTEAYARMPHDDVWQPEHGRSLLTHQGRAFASRVPHRPFSFWVDVPLGQHT